MRSIPAWLRGQVTGPAGDRRMLGELRMAVADPHIVALYLTAGQNAGAFAVPSPAHTGASS